MLFYVYASQAMGGTESSYVFRIEEKEDEDEEVGGEQCIVTHRVELVGRPGRRAGPFRVELAGSRMIHLYEKGSMDVFMLPPSFFLPTPLPPLHHPTPLAPAYSLLGGSQMLQDLSNDFEQGLTCACTDLVVAVAAQGKLRLYDFSA